MTQEEIEALESKRIPPSRYRSLMAGDDVDGPNLTVGETYYGWHFCTEWDGLLISPAFTMEWEPCRCFAAAEKAAIERRWEP